MLIWTLKCVYLWIRVFIFFSYIPKSGIAGSYNISNFNFWGILILFFIVASPISFPTHNYSSYLSPISLPPFVICCLFEDNYLKDVWWYVIVALICIPWIKGCWTSSQVPVGHLYIFFEDIYLGLLPMF